MFDYLNTAIDEMREKGTREIDRPALLKEFRRGELVELKRRGKRGGAVACTPGWLADLVVIEAQQLVDVAPRRRRWQAPGADLRPGRRRPAGGALRVRARLVDLVVIAQQQLVDAAALSILN